MVGSLKCITPPCKKKNKISKPQLITPPANKGQPPNKPPKKFQSHLGGGGGEGGVSVWTWYPFWGVDYLSHVCPMLLRHYVVLILFRVVTMLDRYTCECKDSIHNIIIGVKDPTQPVYVFSYSVKFIFDGYHNMKDLCMLELVFESVLLS